jgi:hypothetical protein
MAETKEIFFTKIARKIGIPTSKNSDKTIRISRNE